MTTPLAPHRLMAEMAAERVRRHIYRSTLSAMLGWPPQRLYNYETGLRQPPLRRVEEIAAALDLRVGLIPAAQTLHLPASTILRVADACQEVLRALDTAGG